MATYKDYLKNRRKKEQEEEETKVVKPSEKNTKYSNIIAARNRKTREEAAGAIKSAYDYLDNPEKHSAQQGQAISQNLETHTKAIDKVFGEGSANKLRTAANETASPDYATAKKIVDDYTEFQSQAAKRAKIFTKKYGVTDRGMDASKVAGYKDSDADVAALYTIGAYGRSQELQKSATDNASLIDRYFGKGTADKIISGSKDISNIATAQAQGTAYARDYAKIRNRFDTEKEFQDYVEELTLGWDAGVLDPENAEARIQLRRQKGMRISQIDQRINYIDNGPDVESLTENLSYGSEEWNRVYAEYDDWKNNKDELAKEREELVKEKERLQKDIEPYDENQSKLDANDYFAVSEYKLFSEDRNTRRETYYDLERKANQLNTDLEYGSGGRGGVSHLSDPNAKYINPDEPDLTETTKTNEEALEWYNTKLNQYERNYKATDDYWYIIDNYDELVQQPNFNAQAANDVDRYLQLREDGSRMILTAPEQNADGTWSTTGFQYECTNPNLSREDQALLLEGQLKNWDQFEEEDLNVIRYLHGTGQDDKAVEYSESMKPILGKREQEDYQAMLAEASTLAKIGLTVAGVGQRVVGAVPAFVEDAAVMITGGEINPYSALHKPFNQGQAIEAQVAQDIDRAMPNLNFFGLSAGQVYQGLQSGIDSAVSRAIFGYGSVVIMAMGAADTQAKELYEKGASKEQIAIGAGIAGIAEGVFEYVSLEMLFKNFMETSPTSKMDFIKKALVQMGVEGSEEVATDIANLIGDAINMHTQSEWAEMMRKYTEQGHSEAGAFGLALWNDVICGELWESFVGGALGTVFSSGGYMAKGLAGTYSAGSSISNSGNIDTLKSLATDINKQGNNTALQESLANVENKPSKMNVGFLAMAVNQEIAKQNEADVDKALRDNGVDDKTAKKVKNAFLAIVNNSDYELDYEERQLLNDEKVLNAYNQVFGKDSSIIARANAFQEAFIKKSGTESEDINLDDMFGDEGKRVIQEIKSKNGDVLNARLAYVEGLEGMKLGQTRGSTISNIINRRNTYMASTPSLDEQLAYNAGRQDAMYKQKQLHVEPVERLKSAEAVVNTVKGLYGKTAVNKNAGLIQDENYKKANLSREKARMLNGIGLAVGTQIRFGEKLTNERGQKVNALYDPNTSTITISTSVKNPVEAALGHEIVHRIRNVSEEAYTSLRDFVTRAMGDEKMQWAIGRREAPNWYNTKDENGFITEEVVADAVGYMFSTDKNLQERLAKEFASMDRKPLQKILDVIRDVIYAIKTRLSGKYKTLSKNQRAEFENLQKNLEAVENAIVTALKEAEERVKVQNEITTDEKSVKSDLKVTEESQNTPVKFSLAHSDEIAETSLKAAREKKDLGFPVSYVRTANAAVKEVADIIKKELAGKKDKNGADLIPEEGELTNNVFDNKSYIKAADPTTECWRQTIYRVMNKNVTDRLGRPLTTKEAIVLNQAAIMIGVDAPCIYCYSLLDRKAKEGYKLQYLAERDGFLNNLYKDFNGDIEEFKRQRSEVFQKYYDRYLSRVDDPAAYKNGKYQKSMARKGNQAKMDRVNLWMDVFESLYGDNKILTANDVRNYETESETRAEYEKISDAKTRDLKLRELDDVIYWAQQASQAKKIVPYSAYGNFGVEDGLLGWSSNLIDKLNSAFGLRWYDHADYHPAFTVDNMQQVIDASIMGLKGLMYCKPTEIAEILAPTGMNINVSCFAQYNEKTGTYEMDDRLGADWNIVQKLRKNHKNVGSVMVVTSDDMLFWALAQDWVDVVIPLHLVRSGSDFVEEFDLNNYTPETEEKIDWKDKYDKYIESLSKNYSAEEFAKKKKGLKESKKTAYPSEHNNDYKTYMSIVNERGLRPKFDRIRQMVENGTAEYQGTKITPDMYMKLVNETRMSAKDTKPLVPKFNVEAAKSAVRSLETKGYYEYFQTSAVNPEDGVAYDVKGWEDIAVRDILAGKTGSQVGYGRDLKTGEILTSKEARKKGVGGKHDTARYSIVSPEENERYMELAQNPEENEKELSALVEKAARNAGYNIRAYHGTNKQFTVFMRGKEGIHFGTIGQALDRVAHSYFYGGSNDIDYEANNAWETARKRIREQHSSNALSYGRVIDAFISANNPVIIDTDVGQWNAFYIARQIREYADDGYMQDIVANEEDKAFLSAFSAYAEGKDAEQDLAKLYTFLQSKGYDSIKYENQFEDNDSGEYSYSYILFDPNQVKSADPVTYDDQGNVIPLSQRFNPNSNDIRESIVSPEEASEYKKLAKDPKKNRAELDSIVRKAANAAGYDSVKLYHGTQAKFNKFDTSKGRGSNFYGDGIYLTSSLSDAQEYAGTNGKNTDLRTNIDLYAQEVADKKYEKWMNPDKWQDAYNKAWKQKAAEVEKKGRVLSLYAKINNPFIVSSKTRLDAEATEKILENLPHSALSEYESRIAEIRRASKTARGVSSLEFAKGFSEYLGEAVRAAGYDGIVDESAGQRFLSDSGTAHVIVFDANQVKSADPVTYNSLGQVIPIDKRFDSKKDDIRYSLVEDSARYLDLAKDPQKNEAELQRMVDEAAKNAGYSEEYFHGTQSQFNSFDIDKSQFGNSAYGIYLGDKWKAAEYGGRGRMIRTYAKTDRIGTLDSHKITPRQFQTAFAKLGLSAQNTYKRYVESASEYVKKRSDWSIAYDLQQWAKYPKWYGKVKSRAEMTPSQILNILQDSLGLDGIERNEELVLWDSTLVKSADPVTYDDQGNVIPLEERFNPNSNDIRESIDYREILDQQIKQYGKIRKGENPYRDIDLPKQTERTKKVSKVAQSVLEAKVTPDKMVPTIKELVAKGAFSFESITDKDAMDRAKQKIDDDGFADAYSNFLKQVSRGFISKDTTAMGWALYDNAATAGDTKAALAVLRAMVVHQRTAAQALQASRILKQMSPEMQLYNFQKSLDDLIERVKKKYKLKKLQINPLLAEQFLAARSDEERDAITRQIYADIAQQLPSKFTDRLRAWRYLCMLGNPKTHLRNFFGNLFFAPIVMTKDAIATGIEGAIYKMSHGKLNRTKAWLTGKQGRELYAAAWFDYKNVKEIALGEGKYNDDGFNIREIDKQRHIFDRTGIMPWNATVGKALEGARWFNNKALDVEDVWFNQPAYAFAMAQYCKANHISPEQIKDGRKLEKARAYSIKEAQKATYRDTNALSDLFLKLGRSSTKNHLYSKAGSLLVEGILPFRKTPANILARGLEYSPLGLLKSLTVDLGRLVHKQKQIEAGEAVTNDITAADVIDHISAGLTGTMLVALGMFLSSMGLVKGHRPAKKKEEKYERDQGHQQYAIEVGGYSFTIDWVAPESIPFFLGVNFYEAITGGDKGLSMEEISQVVSRMSEPMIELSCLSGINDMIEDATYALQQGESLAFALPASAANSYFLQYFPTVGGQLERTLEDKRYTTFVDKNKWVSSDAQRLIGQAANKIPGVEYSQVPYIDGWGREETTGEWWYRAVNNFFNPANVKKINETEMDEELTRLSEVIEARDNTDSAVSVFPTQGTKKITVDKKEVDFTADQYVAYNSARGAAAYEVVGMMMTSKEYKKMSDDEKIAAITSAYSYSGDVGRMAIQMPTYYKWTNEAYIGEQKYKIPVYQFIILDKQLEAAQGVIKDGKTVTGTKSLRKMQIIYNTPGLTDKQKQYLINCKCFDIGDSVKQLNPSAVDKELRKKGG